MARAMICYSVSRLIPSAVTNVGSDSVDSSYPLTSLSDLAAFRFAKWTAGANALQIQFDFGAAVSPNVIALINHNLNVGNGAVTIAANSSASWGSPPFSAAITTQAVNAWDNDYYFPNAWLDLTNLAAHSYRYWLIATSGANGNSPITGTTMPWAIGEIVFYSARTILPINFEYPYRYQELRDGGASVFSGGGVKWSRGSLGRRRRIMTSVDYDDARFGSYWPQLVRSSDGDVKPILLAPDSSVSDCLLASVDTPLDQNVAGFNSNQQALQFTELSVGKSNSLLGF